MKNNGLNKLITLPTIYATVLGIGSADLQPSNTSRPIEVTESGIVIGTSDLQF
jgi:hypothetical protein